MGLTIGEVRGLIHRALEERFPVHLCPVCGHHTNMVKFWAEPKEEDPRANVGTKELNPPESEEGGERLRCLNCNTLVIQKLEVVQDAKSQVEPT